MANMRGMKGFTLIELMIVVAVIAILASVAMASYQGSVLKTRRAKAAGCLTELAQGMERYYTLNFKYTDAVLPNSQCRTELGDYYTFAFSGTPNATTYSITATPKNAQLKDTKCNVLSIDHKGVKGKTGTATVNECW